jgi:hypothetical protein
VFSKINRNLKRNRNNEKFDINYKSKPRHQNTNHGISIHMVSGKEHVVEGVCKSEKFGLTIDTRGERIRIQSRQVVSISSRFNRWKR